MQTIKIIKIGGNIIDNEKELISFLKQFSTIEGHKILVHGGGKLATQLAEKMNIKVQMIDGRRITNSETLDIITMVYAGKINKNIVATLQSFNCNSIGFSGADGNTIIAKKRPVKPVNYGFVGDVTNVNTSTIELLLHNNITPVFCAISHNKNGQLLNTNADTIASELAIGLSNNFKTELYYCFEKNGVLKNINDDNSVITNITSKSYQHLIDEKIIVDGMLPKINNCFNALNNNVHKVCIGKPTMLFNSNATYTTLTK